MLTFAEYISLQILFANIQSRKIIAILFIHIGNIGTVLVLEFLKRNLAFSIEKSLS
jgi:hypothetical protein